MREDELQQAGQDGIPEDTPVPGAQGGEGSPCRETVENGECSTGKLGGQEVSRRATWIFKCHKKS